MVTIYIHKLLKVNHLFLRNPNKYQEYYNQVTMKLRELLAALGVNGRGYSFSLSRRSINVLFIPPGHSHESYLLNPRRRQAVETKSYQLTWTVDTKNTKNDIMKE